MIRSAKRHIQTHDDGALQLALWDGEGDETISRIHDMTGYVRDRDRTSMDTVLGG